MLRLDHYAKRYHEHLVLQFDHLTFEKGAYWIKGENGSGKTTLFKSIAGVIPFEGSIQFADGIDVKKNPKEYRGRISYSEAEPIYPGFLTSKDLIRFVGNIRKSDDHQRKKYTEAFGVETFLEKPVETYSSGMVKKLALTLAFLGSPQLIILDEPLITLDGATRQVLFDMIKEKLAENVIFLLSSHQSIAPEDVEVTGTYEIQNKTIQQG
ncbi:MAG: ABC transporter ATP-binding protein [Cyclobacteriaceae bacterium]|nr:ABC transporter ATP-binding protein [Cyclobacteriaceae bacterium]